MMEFLTGILEGLGDPASLLPDLSQVFEGLADLARIAVYAGPVCLMVLGFVYYFLAPKEANHHLGFRCWWGMSSVEVWRFTQKLAGILWGALGLVLTLIAFFSTGGYGAMTQQAMLMNAASLILWQIAAVLVSILVINLILVILYDSKGCKRSEKVRTAK